MWRKVASVGGLTLLSRGAGFLRDLMMAAVLGAGPLADAFMVAFRLPNHFRAIFAEGAFNAAFVPGYAGTLAARGPEEARRFAAELMGLTVLVQAVLLALALVFAPFAVSLIAPGFTDDPAQFALTVALTRVTFPYLMFIAVMTLVSGVLNAHERFAAAAATSILLNIAMIAAMLMAPWFPTVAHALAWGVTVSGVLQLALVLWDAWRAGIPIGFALPRWNANLTSFLKGFGPAVLGSAGVQIAMFADTILASLLPAGSVSYLYYADRLYQLPLGVIGIAIGTVLLPELAKRVAVGDEAGARRSLWRAIEGSLLLTLPFVVVFLLMAREVMALLFQRGAFDDAAANGSALALQAYAIGLSAIVLIRSLTAAFYARNDTASPVVALAVSIAVNVALKLLLVGPWLHAGLAFATAVGAWVNAGVLALMLARRGLLSDGAEEIKRLAAIFAAALAAAGAIMAAAPFAGMVAFDVPALPGLVPVAVKLATGAAAYLLVLGAARLAGIGRPS